MKLEGRIIVAQPIQSGVSKNGNNWQRQDFRFGNSRPIP